jgi:hypothetical protein
VLNCGILKKKKKTLLHCNLSNKISHRHVYSSQPSEIPTQQEKSQQSGAPETLFANGEAAEDTLLHPPTLRLYALVLARP